MYSRNMVCFRYIIVNTLHKRDNNDDDDDDDDYDNNNINNKRTIPNDKPNVVIHDNKKGTYMLIGEISGDKCDQERN